ncbi:hypothetical protein ABFS83_08G098100 [Erythranthe nasuta]
MDSKPVTLVDEDLQTIREITSDSGEYDDLGDQSYECQSCSAMMWYGERIDKQKGTSNPKFSMCCNGGKVELPNLIKAPDPLKILLFGTDRRSKHFQEHIRSYNMMFSFTSFGGKIQTTINTGSGPYTFLLHGQNYHLMGSLLPDEGSRPKFAQIYKFDTENEVKNRMDAVRSGDSSSELDPEIVSTLKDMVDSSNMLAHSYRAARDRLSQTGMEDVKLRLIKKRSTDGRTYNLPNFSEIAGLIVGDFDTQEGVRDIDPEKIWRQRDSVALKKIVPMVESERLKFIRFNQDKLKVNMYKGIEESILKGDTDARSISTKVILPGSFTQGPRYMFNNLVDALQICNWIEFPSLFITISCNPQWPEIQRALSGTNLRPEDRPDILTRVFKMKLDSLMLDLKKGKIFGRIRAYVCTIEFQKHGLPHAHILIWLHNEDKPKTPKDIDKIICAEILDKVTDRKMYDLVEKYMIHGSCGLANQNSPCMKDGICTKQFPKSFVNRTEADADGYPVYKIRENGRTVVKKKTYLDNGFVVPYNRALLKKYRAHINVELCNQNKSIKYLFKYVNKGHDRVMAAFYQSNNPGATPESRDEIKMYYDCRYLSACEAAWRLFTFDIYFRDPPEIRLSFHLSDNQSVVFTDNDSLVDVLNKSTAKQTMFLAWYEEFPQKFVYKEKARCWIPRKIGFSIGRVTNVPPGRGEDYYLRLLLNFQRGCTCYDDLRKVEDHVYPTFKDACFAFGLLDDDNEYIAGINEANEWASGDYVRRLFVVLLVAHNMSRPEHVWESCWKEFAEDIAYRLQQRRTNSGPPVSDDTLRNYALIEIENILQSNNKSLSNFPPMPIPIGSMTDDTVNRLVLDELDYDVDAMGEELKKYLSSITDEQKKGGLFFLYGHGGTGKTFIWKTLSAAIRSKGEIVINVASSGIASLLLSGGRTAHSRFGLPINRQCKVMKLNKNIRLESSSSSANADEIREFADRILRIGNGDAGEINDGDTTIKILDDMLIRNSADPFLDLIEFVYPDLVTNLFTPEYFEGRAILAPTNESVGFMNDHFLSIITGEEKVYFSSDSMCKEELLSDVNAEIYSPEFLNTISCSGIPLHKLTLKRGVPVMLIRNIDQARGLCNGTRLQIINMGKHVLNCRILSGKHVGDMVFIPRMTLVPSNSALPIKFQRRQFPLMDKTLSHVGLYLPRPVFSHGQLYVALSRVKSRSGINILINSESGDTTNVTNNVVYKEVFQRI